MNFDAWVYKGLLSDGEFHENWHRKSPALLTVVLHIMLLDHESLCRECHTFPVTINEIIFAHVPGCLGKVCTNVEYTICNSVIINFIFTEADIWNQENSELEMIF